MSIDPDGRQYTKREDRATNILRCNNGCKGKAQEISAHVFTIIKEHAWPLSTEEPDIKLSVNAKAKEVQQADKTKKARAVILPLLKASEI
jgi:ribosomal protein L31E